MTFLNAIVVLLLGMTMVAPVYALDASPSSAVKQLEAEIASKAAALAKNISSKLQNRVYIGKVLTKSDTSITIATRLGSKIVTINQDTDFPISLRKIVPDSEIASLGDIDEQGVLTARRVVLLDTEVPVKTILWGVIVSYSDQILTIKGFDEKNMAISAKKKDLPSGLNTSDTIIVTGLKGKNEILNASFVYKIASAKSQESTPSSTLSGNVSTIKKR